MMNEIKREEVIAEETLEVITNNDVDEIEVEEISMEELKFFVLGILLICLGIIVGYLIPYSNPNIPSPGEVVGYTGIGVIIYTFFRWIKK